MTVKNIRTMVAATVLVILVVVASFPGLFIRGAEEFVYYGVVKCRLSFAYVSIVAVLDGTNVRVYSLPDHALLSEVNLNALGKHFVSLPNGTIFKVVSDRFVSVVLLSALDAPGSQSTEGPSPLGFLPSTDGSYVGKEFVGLGSQSLADMPYRILALEPSTVTISKEDGSSDPAISLKANEYRDVALEVYKSFKITSTGNIMVEGARLTNRRTFFIPSVEGSYVGTHFFSSSYSSWDLLTDQGFRISSLQDAKVTIWDVKYKRAIETYEVKGEGGITIQPKPGTTSSGGEPEILMESDKPITVSIVHNKTEYSEPVLRAGTAFMGIRPDEETPFFIPLEGVAEAYFFAYEDTVVYIDDAPLTIKADSYFTLSVPGTHKIKTHKNIVIQLIHWTMMRSVDWGVLLEEFGAPVPSVQTVNLTKSITLTPLAEEGGFLLTYIIIGAVAVIAVAVVVFITMKRRPKK